ncbi:hypothetical protein TNCV_1710981 [Trichonephila clavipes]|nr:hypothetical protein TNCV_1710981 [Trichonephila clavipes]
MREKGGNHLVPGLDNMVDAFKFSNQSPRISGESLQTCVTWRCPDGTQHLFCCPILAVSSHSLASNGPVVDSRYLNLVFGPTEATHNKLFLSKYTVRAFLDVSPGLTTFSAASPRFDHDHFHTILSYVTHFSSSVTIRLRNESISFRLARASQIEIRSIMFFFLAWHPNIELLF